jgi:hypothetical protein
MGIFAENLLLLSHGASLALTSFHARILLIDDVDTALAAYNAAIFVTLLGGFQ